MMKDLLRLLSTFYRLQFSQSLKSPVNFWTSTLVQVVYYAAQLIFWAGIRSTDAGWKWMSDNRLYGFLVTVALVDNLYLFIVGRGSMTLMQRIESRTLDGILLWPRSKLGVLVWMTPNWTYFPCAILSLAFFVGFHVGQATSPSLIAWHFIACVVGVLVMDGISFLFRITTFWSSAMVRIRHANPSYKIMVRPYDAFGPKARLVLLTIFPALFITGVPAQISSGDLDHSWVFAGLLVCGLLWVQVAILWKIGISRYGRLDT